MIARRAVLARLARVRSGRLTVCEGGRRHVFGSGTPQATVVVRSPRAWTAALRGAPSATVAVAGSSAAITAAPLKGVRPL